MTDYNLEITLARIASATPFSKIAVFRTKRLGMLNSVFAATSHSHRLIKAKDPLLIGVYDRTMDLDAIAKELSLYVQETA